MCARRETAGQNCGIVNHPGEAEQIKEKPDNFAMNSPVMHKSSSHCHRSFIPFSSHQGEREKNEYS
jgi:hypothetical protein